MGNYEELGGDTARAARVRADYEVFLKARANLLLTPMAALCRGDIPA